MECDVGRSAGYHVERQNETRSHEKLTNLKTILITAAILVALPISAEMDGGHVGDPEHIKPVKKVYSPGHQVFY